MRACGAEWGGGGGTVVGAKCRQETFGEGAQRVYVAEHSEMPLEWGSTLREGTRTCEQHRTPAAAAAPPLSLTFPSCASRRVHPRACRRRQKLEHTISHPIYPSTHNPLSFHRNHHHHSHKSTSSLCVVLCALQCECAEHIIYPRTICAHGLRAVAMGTRAHIHTLVYRTDIQHIRIYYAIACVYPVHSQRVHKWNSSGCDVDGGMATAAAAASIAATASAAATATAAASLAGDV